MAIRTPDDLTAAVLAAMAQTPDARQRQLLTSLVRHLHAFVRETQLTEAEFRDAAALVNRIGQLSTDTHNEAVLMAGTLGVSALVCLLQHVDPATGETAHNLLGPFWRLNAPATASGGSLLRSPTAGPALLGTLRVVDRAGTPVAGADVDIWHCAPNGLYENQDDAQADHNLRGRFVTDADGRIAFRSVKPVAYPIPTDTAVGDLLRLQGRSAMRPAHVHALVHKSGFETLVTQLYDRDDPHVASDPQFGATDALCLHWQRHDAPHPQHADIEPPWYELSHTLVLAPGQARWPRAPIR
jgi:catechol 1,2-dioxygenase